MKRPACALLVCVLIAGCGGGGSSKPKPISGSAKEAATVIQRLQNAIAQRDFTTICNELFADVTRRQAGGDSCADVLDQRARGVRRPHIRINSIEVAGDQARVRVRTTASGQAPISDVIRLVREHGRFKVLSLGR